MSSYISGETLKAVISLIHEGGSCSERHKAEPRFDPFSWNWVYNRPNAGMPSEDLCEYNNHSFHIGQV